MLQITRTNPLTQAAARVVDRAHRARSLGESVLQSARRRLSASPYASLRSISCEYHEGVLALRGRASSYYHKQLAQETVRSVPGVQEIFNAVEVVDLRRS